LFIQSLTHEWVRASVLYPLDPAFGAVVDNEVDGDSSLPARLEAHRCSPRAATAGKGLAGASLSRAHAKPLGMMARSLAGAIAPGFAPILRDLVDAAQCMSTQTCQFVLSCTGGLQDAFSQEGARALGVTFPAEATHKPDQRLASIPRGFRGFEWC
jgi:hypothetical protein